MSEQTKQPSCNTDENIEPIECEDDGINISEHTLMFIIGWLDRHAQRLAAKEATVQAA